jgi:capsular exopolysaccharide synthesis family protein
MSETVSAPSDKERDSDAPSPAAIPASPSAETADLPMSDKAKRRGDLDLDFDAPLLGVVPLPRDGEDLLLAMLDPPPWAAEAHHAIFRALDEIVKAADHRVLLLTSISPHEGKSMVAVRLSASFAAAGKNVLMIDADMRRGSLHRMLGLSNRVGFSDLLAADSAPALTNVAQYCEVAGLSIVPRGQPATNPTELLASKRLADVLDEAVDLYDIVIMEGPPALGLVDAPCLGGMADATVFVLQADRTPREHAKLAIRRLSQAGAGQIALVITTFDSAKDIGGPNHAAGMAGQFVAEEPPPAEAAPAHFESLHRNPRQPDRTS